MSMVKHLEILLFDPCIALVFQNVYLLEMSEIALSPQKKYEKRPQKLLIFRQLCVIFVNKGEKCMLQEGTHFGKPRLCRDRRVESQGVLP